MCRGEMPNEPGDSLFSPKQLWGWRHGVTGGGRALYGGGGARLTEPWQTTNTVSGTVAVGPWEMSFMVERERARTCG